MFLIIKYIKNILFVSYYNCIMSVLLLFFVIGALICASLPAETNIVFLINLNGIEYWEPRLDWR